MLALSACVTAPNFHVADVNAKPINASQVSCKSPFKLTQSCSAVFGPSKRVTIDGVNFKVSGNKNGTITLMYPNAYGKSNQAYTLMKNKLVNHGFQILSVIPIVNGSFVQGYAISTKEPSYQIWDQFLTKK